MLTLQSAQALHRLQAGKSRHGYRTEDLVAARVVADALAATLQTQGAVP